MWLEYVGKGESFMRWDCSGMWGFFCLFLEVRIMFGLWLVFNKFVLNKWMKLEGFELDNFKFFLG